ncbi:MAG: MFS transporter [Deltaproteobacteria bacterium]|nr:MFS transporter [Deltaproteobacteria bacterium]
MSPNERNILTVTSFGHFMSHFNMLVFPALVLPLTAHFSLELPQVLALSFWMYLLFGVTALPWGLLSDTFGAKPMLFLFHGGAGLCGLAAAFFMDSPWRFSLCLTGIGLFSGIYHPAGLGMISKGMSRMSVAMGYNGMAGNAGLASAPILAGMINYRFGPQAVYLFLGALNLLGAVVMLLMPCADPENNAKPNHHSARSLFTGFAVLCVCMMLGGVAYRGSTVILPTYFELRTQTLFEALSSFQWWPASRNVAATALTSLVFVVGILGQYVGGRAAERFDPRKGYLLFHSAALPMALLMAYATDLPLFLVTMFYMLFLLGMQPIENTLVARLTPEKIRHSGYGIKFVLTFGVGALAVRMVGWIERGWSLSAVFVAMALVSLGIVAFILLLRGVTRSMRLAD